MRWCCVPHIKVNDGHLEAVDCDSVGGADRDRVKDTEATATGDRVESIHARMVPRWAHEAECRNGRFFSLGRLHRLVDGSDDGPGRAGGRAPRAGGDDGHTKGLALGKETLGEHGRQRSRHGVEARAELVVHAPHSLDQPIRVHMLQRCDAGGLKVRGEHHPVHPGDRAVDLCEAVCCLLMLATSVVPSTVVVLKNQG